jgi:hypothetical protein
MLQLRSGPGEEPTTGQTGRFPPDTKTVARDQAFAYTSGTIYDRPSRRWMRDRESPAARQVPGDSWFWTSFLQFFAARQMISLHFIQQIS